MLFSSFRKQTVVTYGLTCCVTALTSSDRNFTKGVLKQVVFQLTSLNGHP